MARGRAGARERMLERRRTTGRVLASAAAVAAGVALCTAAGSPRPAPAARDDHRPPGRAFTLLATGDVIPYPSIVDQARADAGGEGYDFRKIFAGARPAVAAADLAVCHLETPFGAPEGPFTGYPVFSVPPQLAGALRDTGYDSCSTASNHALDGGTDGVRRTLAALDEAGVAHAGTGRTRGEAARPALLRAGGARVAHLSYTAFSNLEPPGGETWAVNRLDPRRIAADACAARRAGADVVVVSLHWGTEWQREPDRRQLRLAERLTRSATAGRKDIDLVLGTHNHVPQAYEKLHGTWVVYGLGDQVASFVPGLDRGNEGSAARFTFTPRGGRWTVTRAEFLAQRSDQGPPFRLVPASADVRERVSDAVLSRGAGADGLRPAADG
ncbi:Capsule biosynthesis protein CapA [Streptomyces sp. RB5]|uniref:Capsule biosynthesis protein CapA n=1 Tax=Streptomyces smaragdinus TaxID=2585196 RepID=A0A7K0CAW2_9ACTN|nr:CapA family protein [Streptomyces smaragdinus]MQY10591.1 Capsule biosynthesis protein CapA [Streptomyces smaragdinus]